MHLPRFRPRFPHSASALLPPLPNNDNLLRNRRQDLFDRCTHGNETLPPRRLYRSILRPHLYDHPFRRPRPRRPNTHPETLHQLPRSRAISRIRRKDAPRRLRHPARAGRQRRNEGSRNGARRKRRKAAESRPPTLLARNPLHA